jgi:hypothetical protein
MSAATKASSESAQSIFQIHKFTSVTDGLTFAGPSSPKAFWAQVTTDPSTNTSAGINVTESSGTYTFYPGVDTVSVTLFIVV